MGKPIALIALGAAIALGGATLGVLPPAYAFIDASRDVRLAVSGVLLLVALGLLARDHRGSEIVSALLLLALSGITGWITFYGPHDLFGDRFEFIPAGVAEAVARLMFGFGVVACGAMAFFGLRRLLR